MEYIHRGFNHPNGGVSPAKHAGHYPGNNADHTIADHAKQGVEKVKKTYKKVKKKVEGGVDKAVDVVKKEVSTATDKVKKGAKKAWDQAGYAYQAYKATPMGKSNIQTVSDVLAVASVPANLIAEAVEGVGGKGDKEFNFSDAMPDLSSDRGSFNFKNMHGKNMKTVSSVTEIKNPYLAFAVDLATDPSTYVGAGVIKGVVKKSIKKSTKALVKSADDITKSNKKQIIKAIDDGPVGPKTGGGVSSNFLTSKWYKSDMKVLDVDNPIPSFTRVNLDKVEIPRMKQLGKNLDANKFDVSSLTKDNITFKGRSGGRTIVEVDLGNGQKQLFYKSTGSARKTGAGTGGTTEGLWQPYAGHSRDIQKGWFGKDAGYEDWYKSKSYRDISGNLDVLATKKGINLNMQMDLSTDLSKSAKGKKYIDLSDAELDEAFDNYRKRVGPDQADIADIKYD
jgi:hypothetical protein